MTAGTGRRPGCSRQRPLTARLYLALAAACCAGASITIAIAQTPAPVAGDGMAANALRGRLGTIDTAAAQRGAAIYRSSCGFCHGAEGRGAQGPDLTASLIVLADAQGRALNGFLKVGRPATGMPAFTNFTEAQVFEMTAFLQARATEGRRTITPNPTAILVGDAKAGQIYFESEGRCVTCHSATGDLKGVGARYNPMVLQGRMINPKIGARAPGSKPAPPVKVTVSERGKAPVSGTLVQINDFDVTLIDADGVRRSFNRDNEIPRVVVDDPMEGHRQMMRRWTDRNMWNVTAYLAGLK